MAEEEKKVLSLTYVEPFWGDDSAWVVSMGSSKICSQSSRESSKSGNWSMFEAILGFNNFANFFKIFTLFFITFKLFEF